MTCARLYKDHPPEVIDLPQVAHLLQLLYFSHPQSPKASVHSIFRLQSKNNALFAPPTPITSPHHSPALSPITNFADVYGNDPSNPIILDTPVSTPAIQDHHFEVISISSDSDETARVAPTNTSTTSTPRQPEPAEVDKFGYRTNFFHTTTTKAQPTQMAERQATPGPSGEAAHPTGAGDQLGTTQPETCTQVSNTMAVDPVVVTQEAPSHPSQESSQATNHGTPYHHQGGYQPSQKPLQPHPHYIHHQPNQNYYQAPHPGHYQNQGIQQSHQPAHHPGYNPIAPEQLAAAQEARLAEEQRLMNEVTYQYSVLEAARIANDPATFDHHLGRLKKAHRELERFWGGYDHRPRVLALVGGFNPYKTNPETMRPFTHQASSSSNKRKRMRDEHLDELAESCGDLVEAIRVMKRQTLAKGKERE